MHDAQSPTRRSRPVRAAAVLVAALVTGAGCAPGPTAPTTADGVPTGAPATQPAAQPEPTPTTPEDPVGSTRIVIVAEGLRLDAHLDDNPAARSLLDQLPVTITMDDFGGQEKIGTPPRPLTMEQMPDGADPDVGTIGYYAPSDGVVLYYADVGYYPGIAVLGQVDGSVDALVDLPDGTPVTIDRAP